MRKIKEILNRNKSNIKLIALFITTLIFFYYKTQKEKNNVLKNQFPIEAKIIGLQGCFKNGKCIEYTYLYKGESFQKTARISRSQSNWCEKNNFCRGLVFPIKIDTTNPDNVIIETSLREIIPD